MHYIDLSQTMFNNMPVYPSDTPVTLFQENFLEKDHYNNFRLQTGMHAGTHIDTDAFDRINNVNRQLSS